MSRNIALVTLDTLRMDAFEEHFDWLDGLRFSNGYSTSHWTIPAHGSLFTGKYPSEIGVHSKSPSLDCPDTVLAEQLADEGYKTRMWSANPNMMFWEGWERGFDEVVDPGALNPNHTDVVDWTEFLNSVNTHSWTKYPKAIWHAIQADCSTVAAVEQGYYETPRRATLTDIAESMDISKATASDILHRAEGKVVDWFVATAVQ